MFFNNLRKLLFILLFTSLTACAGATNSDPATAIKTYFQALAGRDANQLISSACADWEENARSELRSFDASSITIEEMKCQVDSQDNISALVSCTGKIVANYGNEVLEINLADRKYLAANERGEWRMCGYQ